MYIIPLIFGVGKENIHKINTYSIWILLFHLLLNFEVFNCEDYICKNNNNFGNIKCFNNIIKLNSKHYRSGQFVTTKNGELIIEYSEDATPGGGRLFYRLKSDGRGYYPGDNPIKEFEITDKVETINEKNEKIYCSGRYEARNILINFDKDPEEKEYLFSTSSWYSFTELYDLESDTYWTWFTSTFFNIPDNKYIFSYIYSLLKQPNSANYFLVYIQYKETTSGTSSSEYYAIKKFSLESNDGNITKTITSVTNNNNFDNRVISAIIMEKINILTVYFVKWVSNEQKFYVKSYDYDLNELKETEVSSFDADKGKGIFFEGVYLSDIYTVVIYYLDKDDTNKLGIKLYKYDSSLSYGFHTLIYKEITDYYLNPYMYNNTVFKINENRVIFTCVQGGDNVQKTLYIYLIDFYSTYSKVIVNIYNFGLSSYNFYKDMASYFFNGLVLFSLTVQDNTNGVYSLLMYFGYSNGNDTYINISPYLLDSNNTDINLNIYNYLKNQSVIENNIFDYAEEDQVKLVSIPSELLLYKSDNTKLSNGTLITENPKMYQNQELIKTFRNYSIYYQLYVKEPDFDHYLSNAQTNVIFENNHDINYDDDMKNEYEQRRGEALPGRTIKVEFKLCFEYCETCKILGITRDDQYCITCLEPYRYDYFNYFDLYPSNCVPEGYYNDRETGKLVKCEDGNHKYYYNTTDGKKYCFKKEYDCPPPYPWLNETTFECLNTSLPTTIL